MRTGDGLMSEQPNIIMVPVDDMGAWGMGCAGNLDIRTPNLDAPALPACGSEIVSAPRRSARPPGRPC